MSSKNKKTNTRFFFASFGILATVSLFIFALSPAYSPDDLHGTAKDLDSQKFSIESSLWHGGFWKAEGTQKTQENAFQITGEVKIESQIFSEFSRDEDEVLLVLTVERFFDQDGHANALNNEYFSTVLTPGGRPIEFSEGTFGIAASCNEQEGVLLKTPIELQKTVSVAEIREKGVFSFSFEKALDDSTPNGIYRPRLALFYVPAGTEENHKCAPQYSFSTLQQTLYPKQEISLQKANPWGESNDYLELQNQVFYLPFFQKGEFQKPKLPAVLFAEYSNQGSRGIVSQEDSESFQIATHEITQSDLILEKGKYSLDLAFPLAASYGANLEERYVRIPLVSGWMQGEILLPNGEKKIISRRALTEKKISDEGPFVSGQRMAWMTFSGEGNKEDFSESGKYSISLIGEMQDEEGNSYEIGGEYSFFVGKTLTFVSAVKPGTSFFTGDVYIPRFAYNPPMLGRVDFLFDFFPFDSSKEPQHIIMSKEDLNGGFSGDIIPLGEPGEYSVKVRVEAHDARGEAYFGAYDAGSLVISRDSSAELHGKIGGNFSDTTDTVEAPRFSLPRNPAHETRRDFFWPYFAGDVLKIADNENSSVNPTVELLDAEGQKITLFPRAEKNLHPFNYPEKITDPAFVFLASQKAGFIGRSLVATDFIDHAFWNLKKQSFGDRINATENGDLENDAYRNFAVAYKKDGEKNIAASYVSTFVVGSTEDTEDKVFAPFDEPYIFHNGKPRLFSIGTSEQKKLGTMLTQYFHVTPAVKGVAIDITVTKPDGSRHSFPQVQTDEGGFTPIGESLLFDQAGVWNVLVEGEYNGKKDTDEYFLFVIAPETVPLEMDIPPFSMIDPQEERIFRAEFPEGLQNPKFEYEVIMPGEILDTNAAGIGESVVDNTGLSYTFDPKKFTNLYKNFEIDPLWARITIFYFHISGELDGEPYNAFRSVMVRNNQMIVME